VSTINYRGTPEEVRRLLRTLPAMLSGKSPDPYGIVRGIQLRVANVVLSKIQQAFIVKSRGGVGSDGIQWPPLKPETIAQRTVSKADRKRAGIGEREWRERQRGLLTPEQNRLWRKKFSRSLAWLRLDMGEREARSRAAQIAWRYVKEELGAKTRLEAFGKRVVDSLRDTGELFRSLSAGVEDQLSGAPGQIVRIPAGTSFVGTNVKPRHHTCIPGRLPKRLLWPESGEIPAEWWPAINRAVLRGIQAAIQMILQGGQQIP